jgi:hypothetical protein
MHGPFPASVVKRRRPIDNITLRGASSVGNVQYFLYIVHPAQEKNKPAHEYAELRLLIEDLDSTNTFDERLSETFLIKRFATESLKLRVEGTRAADGSQAGKIDIYVHLGKQPYMLNLSETDTIGWFTVDYRSTRPRRSY